MATWWMVIRKRSFRSCGRRCEFGADIIKADPTNDPGVYSQVIQTAGGIPVLVRGGSKAPEAEILARTRR